MRAADWIGEIASEHGASLLHSDGGVLCTQLGLPRGDGRTVEFMLEIDGRHPVVVVREKVPAKLPGFCPERHINFDGSFCLTWQKAAPLTVASRQEAETWWATVLSFLWLQERAARLRRWPETRAWAHGDQAAAAQRNAEAAAEALGPRYRDALAQRRLSVARAPGRDFLLLMESGRRRYSVWEKARRVATLGQACLCGNSRKQLRACGDHAEAAAELVFALVEWERAERRFWASMKGQPCCGTIDNCPLAN